MQPVFSDFQANNIPAKTQSLTMNVTSSEFKFTGSMNNNASSMNVNAVDFNPFEA